MKKYLVPGLILILAGVYFLIEALPGVSLPFGAFFALVGAALLVGRLFARGKYGLSIAGFLLLCLGLAWALLDVLSIGNKYVMVATPLAVSLAFFLLHICEYRRIGNWPMVPALVLLAFAVLFFLMLTPSVNDVLKPYYGTILPLILILIGVCILVRGARGNKRERRRAEEAQPGDPSTWAQPPLHAQPQPAPEAQEPFTAGPVEQEPIASEPPVQEPIPAEPAAQEPIILGPAAQEPAAAEPVTIRPEAEAPAPQESSEESAPEEEKKDGPAAE